jgi:serine/threonine protein kinase
MQAEPYNMCPDGPVARIGDYRVVTELARGGMGRVYLARRCGQAGFERLFAIKVMSQRLSGDAEATLMLLDEAHIASRLHHPNLVSVHDIGRHEHGYYLVMDYVEGCSLQQLLARNKSQRPARLIVPILIEALRGLHAAHGLCNADGEPYKVVHRDVSPHNLLLGIDGACRVTDFGIAKAKERYTDTQSGVFKGKIGYVAPEQLGCGGRVDLRADIWAAGVTLYVALTGQFPFEGKSPVAIARSIVTQPLLPPSRVGLRPPAVLDQVVMRALAREPEQRYPSAEAFADALRGVAIAHDLLGTPAEVAAWVDASCGSDLAERRRVLAAQVRPDSGSFTRSEPRAPVPLGSAAVPLAAPADATRSRRSQNRPRHLRRPLLRALALGFVALSIGVALGLRDRESSVDDSTPKGEIAVPAVHGAPPPAPAPVVRLDAPPPGLAPRTVAAPSAAVPPRPPRVRAQVPLEPTPLPEVAPPARPAVPDIAEPRVTRNPYLHGR